MNNVSFQNLFVAKLPRSVTDENLMTIFREFEPRSAKVMLDATTGKSKGFGFVLFPTATQGALAHTALNHTFATVNDHNFLIVAFPSKHNGEAAVEESVSLFIRNIPNSLTHDEIDALLAQFGSLVFTAIRPDHLGCAAWVVYAEFDSVESSRRALQKLHGCRDWESVLKAPILAKFADSDIVKRERQQKRRGSSGSDNTPRAAASRRHTRARAVVQPQVVEKPVVTRFCHNPYSSTKPIRLMA